MSISSTARDEERWSRPLPARTDPVRTAGGLFRTAADGRRGLGGLPLNAAEDAVVAAVRMAYKVAEAQVERSARLAQRLREAGDRAAGPRSDKQALDATQQLIFRAGMSALSWLEAAAAEPGSPLWRLMVAQYRLLGSTFGLIEPEKEKPGKPRPSHHDMPKRVTERGEAATSPARTPAASLRRIKIVLEGGHPRPVCLRQFEIESEGPINEGIKFYSVNHIESEPITARLAIDSQDGAPRLSVEVQRLAPPGLWRAAVCDREKAQIGMIEIEL